MYLIIVGAGIVSKQLVSIAIEQGHKVAVVEKNKERAREIMAEYDVRVFHADIAKGNVLGELNVKDADAIIATTNDDSVNLMAMMLGKHHQVEYLITMLQEAEHCGMFEQLGIRVLSDPEKLIANKLFSFVDSNK